MKKIMLTVSAFALVAMMAACGTSPESKAKDLAKQTCDCMKSENPDACMNDLEKESEEYVKGLKGEDSTKFVNAFQEAVMPCVMEAMNAAMKDVEL